MRRNILAGLVALIIPLVWLGHSLDLVVPGIFDQFVRAWPVLLVITGLIVLLKRRVPFAEVIAVLVAGVLVVGVSRQAFSTRIEQQRDDQRVPIEATVSDGVVLLRVLMQTLATDVEITLTAIDAAPNAISGEFVGSLESTFSVSYLEGTDNVGELTISEVQTNPYPMLEAVGRGNLLLELPPDVPVDVQLEGINGNIFLNMTGISLERMNLDLIDGQAVVTLPVRAPEFSEPTETLGTLAARNGDMTVRVPDEIAARFELLRGTGSPDPVYDPAVYNFLVGDVLEARDIDGAAIVQRYTLDVPRGLVTINVP